MNELDALTLQLLSSKKRYNKYLESAQPNKANEIQEFYGKIRKYRSRILQTVNKYLDKPETQTTTDVDENIEACFKTLIRHYEILNKEQKSYLNDYDETDSSDDEADADANEDADEDADANEDASLYEANEILEEPKSKPASSKSFWGNSVVKSGSTTLDAFIQKKSKNK
jgi:hypothetical protein